MGSGKYAEVPVSFNSDGTLYKRFMLINDLNLTNFSYANSAFSSVSLKLNVSNQNLYANLLLSNSNGLIASNESSGPYTSDGALLPCFIVFQLLIAAWWFYCVYKYIDYNPH